MAIFANEPGPDTQNLAKTLKNVPGIAIFNYVCVSGSYSKEIDCILITPDGLRVVEVKKSNQQGELVATPNHPWTIGTQEVLFAGGNNPLSQTRLSAQKLRAFFNNKKLKTPFIVAVCSVDGNKVEPMSAQLGDTWVCTTDQLPATLLGIRRQTVWVDTALAILTALGWEHYTRLDMLQAGFQTRPMDPGKPKSAPVEVIKTPKINSADRRRQARFEEMANQAKKNWITSGDRRIIASAVVLILVVAYGIIVGVGLGWVWAATVGALAAVLQLFRRMRLDGLRSQGKVAFLAWLVTLSPWVGVGLALYQVLWAAANITQSVDDGLQWAYSANFSLLMGLLFAASTLIGRSPYIYPPEVVLERYDKNGKPTGQYMLVDASPRSSRGKRGFKEANIDPVLSDIPDIAQDEHGR